MNTKDRKELEKKLTQELSALSNEDLIKAFNNKVGLKYFNIYLSFKISWLCKLSFC